MLPDKLNYSGEAGFCPADITISCHMPYTDTNMTGTANVYGSGYTVARYYDDTDNIDRCNVGFVIRTWYADKNNNYQHDPYELSCQQRITITDLDQEVTVTFPQDITVDCPDDIPATRPTYQGGICDQIAVNITDVPFTVVEGACLKIERTFTIINWCDYRPSDPDWDGSGRFVGTQSIKVAQRAAPRLAVTGDFDIGVSADCQAQGITLHNVATEYGDCPSDELQYEFYIDLDWDGEMETRYSHLLTGDYFLAPAPAGDSVEVTLVETLPIGKYKYKWSVTDGCGNFRSAEGVINVVDNKPPTPYCLLVAYSTVGGDDMPLTVRSSLFDRGAFDNCTDPEHIQISFSEDVTDTLRVVDCNSRGIQFYRLYATDLAGNSDYCNVFLLAFDNGNCGPIFRALGQVSMPDGEPVPDIEVAVIDPTDQVMGQAVTTSTGEFAVEDLELYQDRAVMVYPNNYDFSGEVTLADFVILFDHVLGYSSNMEDYTAMAADLSGDGRLTGRDLSLLADHIIGWPSDASVGSMQVVPADLIEQGAWTGDDYLFTDYDGSFDYTAYVMGDLDNSASLALGSSNQGRQSISLAVSTDGGRIDVDMPSDLDVTHMMVTTSDQATIDISGKEMSSGSYDGRAYHIAAIDSPTLSLTDIDNIDDVRIQVLTSSGDIVDVELTMTVSSEETATKTMLACYPNPVASTLFFDDLVVSADLLNMSGQLVATSRDGRPLSVASLGAGVYIAKMSDRFGSTTYQRVVVTD
jgi:hypothetical protein